MKRKDVLNKAMAAVISISMAAGSVVPLSAAEAVVHTEQEKAERKENGQNTAETETKDENVYVTLLEDGSVDGIYVINEYVLEEGTELVDYGNYTEVKNLSSEDEITYEDGKVTVKAPAGRFYYQGTLQDTEIPWNISIAYYLDGEKISAEELAGKSGKLKIELGIHENKACESEFFENYLVQATVTLNTEKCSNIKADGSTQANVGKNRQLLYNIMAGQEREFTITAEVTDFEMDAMTFQAVPMSFDIDSDSFDKTALYEKMDEITDAAAEFDEGADELVDGAKELADGVSELQDGSGELKDGAKELQEGSGELASGAKELADGADTLNSGMNELNSGSSELNRGTKRINQGASDLKKGAKELADGAKSAKTGSKELSEKLEELAGSFEDMQEGTTKIKNGLEGLTTKSPELTGGSEKVLTALKTIQSSLATIEVGTDQLTSLVEASKSSLEAITSAKTGAETLSSGAKALKDSFTDETSIAALKAQNANAATYLSALVAQAQEYYKQYGAMLELALPDVDAAEIIKTMADISGLLLQNNETYGTLEENVGELSGKLDTLAVSLGTFEEKYKAFDKQIQSLPTVLSAMIVEKMQPLKDGIDELIQEYGKLDTGIGTYTESVASIKEGYDTLYAGLLLAANGTKSLAEGAGTLASGAAKLSKGANKLYSGTKELKSGAKELNEGAGTLSSGISEATAGTKSLSSGANELNRGAAELNAGTGELYDGTTELYDGVGELMDGIRELQEGTAELKDGTTEFVDKTADIDTQIDEEIERVLEEIAGADFTPFSFTSEKNTEIGLVQFAMQTSAVKKPEEPKQLETEEETESFSEKLKDLFQ